MNREERRHPEKRLHHGPKEQKPQQPTEQPQEEESARAKSHRHKKVTADKWNQ